MSSSRTWWTLPTLWLFASCAAAPPPDIVLITIDTLRADRLGAYGYVRDTSPTLDALAAESLVFERCLAPMATTFPSHLSLLTSTYPHETGAIANAGAGGAPFTPTPSLRSLAQILSDAGYQTAAFVSASPLKRYSGIAAGFDVFDQPEERTRDADETNTRVREWLASKGDAPSLLWVHYFEPHSPYEPPDSLIRKFRPDDELARYLTDRSFEPAYRADTLPVHVNARYDAEVRRVDEQIGQLLDELRAKSTTWDRTIVVVLGDHGEGLGQHGEKEHGGLWNEHLHVPLMMRIPGAEATRIDALMSVADVVPTLLGMVELPNKEAFLRQASGSDRLVASDERPLIFSQESSAPWRTEHGARRPGYALTGNEWKLLHDPDGADRLFNLADDPFELDDLSEKHPDIAERLRTILLARVEQHKARKAALGAGSTNDSSRDDVDPAILEELRALGYVQ